MAPLNAISDMHTCNDISVATYAEAKNYPLHTLDSCPPGRKTISFSFTVQVHEVLSLTKYSLKEIENTWYSKYELGLIKGEARVIVKKIARGENDPKSGEWTSRGLESRTTAGNKEKMQHRRYSQAAVFMEQEWQDENGINDPEALADIYHEHTEFCQFIASATGSRDAAEASY
eukprot:scaffold853_cov103-Cylindrotheca_fusiformis.AAC.4